MVWSKIIRWALDWKIGARLPYFEKIGIELTVGW